MTIYAMLVLAHLATNPSYKRASLISSSGSFALRVKVGRGFLLLPKRVSCHIVFTTAMTNVRIRTEQRLDCSELKRWSLLSPPVSTQRLNTHPHMYQLSKGVGQCEMSRLAIGTFALFVSDAHQSQYPLTQSSWCCSCWLDMQYGHYSRSRINE